MVDSTYYLDKNMPDRYMHNIYLYGPGQFAQVVSRWNCESLVGHIPLALEDLDPTYQRGGPLGFGSQDIYSGLGVFRSYTATRWTKPNF